MNSYYKEKLYPLQDKVFNALEEAGLPFYLTGGTALHRCYYQVRYSDDLDFFVNDAPDFSSLQDEVIRALKNLDCKIVRRSAEYLEMTVGEKLKVDFVNDVPAHLGEIETFSLYYRVDNVFNILANKLGALLHREEPKDVVDIWVIWRENEIDWPEMFTAAGSKAAGIYPPQVGRKIDEMPETLLEKIKFTEQDYLDKFVKEKEKLVNSILAKAD